MYNNSESKDTKTWAFMGIILSIFTIIPGLIISAVALSKSKSIGKAGKFISIIGLLISGLKLLLIIVVCLFVYYIIEYPNAVAMGNTLKCISTTSCVESEDGYKKCQYKDEEITCAFDINEVMYEYNKSHQGENNSNITNESIHFYHSEIDYILNNIENIEFKYNNVVLNNDSKLNILYRLKNEEVNYEYQGTDMEEYLGIIEISYIDMYERNITLNINLDSNKNIKTISFKDNNQINSNYTFASLINISDFLVPNLEN